ncbi:MAG: hypothetical protein MUE40_18730 [Anaerolineae bacterium]|jgi:hypothetical protein|nr:hypothetical protein [Anaerolineae bacterium]
MVKRWSVTDEMLRVHLTQVFSGGACNIIDAEGKLTRNSERDRINDWLTGENITFFDPQIHPDTHGYEYDYGVHHPLEMAARQAAKVNLYEISPCTFGGITSLEIAIDHIRRREPTVIYYSDGEAHRDQFPPHRNGHPLFQPSGIHTSEIARAAHYKEFRKLGTNMRRYLIQLARELDTLTVTFGDDARKGDMIISPTRMHAVDMFTAAIKAADGERVFLNFAGDTATRDDKGIPLFMVPEKPTETQLHMLLDQYIDEGCQLRRAIADLVQIGVFLRVVYTQQSAILALDEMLKYCGIKPYQHLED